MPFLRSVFHTALSPDQVMDHLATITAAGPIISVFRRAPRDAVFVGKVRDGSFTLRRNIRYKNSFLPIVRGSFERESIDTRVTIYMHIHPVVAVFLAVWIAGVVFALVETLRISGFSSRGALVGALMLVFAVALTAGGFFPEAFIARRLLKAAIEGK